MSTITKEQLSERARGKVKSLEFAVTQTAFADSRAELEEELELARIALASLELERGMIRRFDLDMSDCDSCGQDCGADMVEDLDGEYVLWDEVLPHLYRYDEYTAPPAPVSVPDLTALDNLAGEMLNHAMNCERRVAVAYTHCAHRLAEEVRDLRAAMLQGVENAESPTTMHPAPALDSSPKIAESPSGNYPVIPDDVRRMDWLVSKTVDVREPMVYGSHSLFWSQTITDEEDEYHATKLREQIDAAMAAEQAAAPQQEVK